MKQDRFSHIDALLDEVLDVSTIEREKILDARCGADAELKREVLSLFEALKKSEDFIETPKFETVKSLVESDVGGDLTGKKIGAYRIKKLLGQGGMSSVYLASRIDDFEKEVALKIIPPFENHRQSAENFRRERQILARLDHPNIARILDGGTTSGGLPFIVMEYVDGLPLDCFCRENDLSVKEKLELFLKVCSAVTFAHQNLIVHRDLKPNNIFVTKNGDVKLLDFGIAKLLDAESFGVGENRTFQGTALTLEYAAPEQITGGNITVASDVYSLGVILYELLTNSRPHKFGQKSLGEIVRIIESEEPAAPSEILKPKAKEQNSELDSIILKSLAKNPAERYPSTVEFCADVTNFLDHKPLSARPANAFYRFRKYVRRHRLESMIAALFLFLIVGWLVTFIWQLRREQAQSIVNQHAAYAAEMILAANEYENSNLNRLREIVEKYEPEDAARDLRGFEWFFLRNLLHPPSKIAAFQHPDEVWNAEFSPDGNSILTAGNDNFVRLWDTRTGAMRQTDEAQKGAWKVAFYPDGKRFAVASSSNSNPVIKIYETASMRPILTLENHTKRVRAVDVSPDGKLIASGGMDGNIIIWNAETGAEIRRFSFSVPDKNIEFYDVLFSANGDKLAVSGFETFAIFDTATWRSRQLELKKIADKDLALISWKIRFSPLGKTIALATYTGEVIFLDTETFEILRVLKIHQANIKSLDFSIDGKFLATASWDRTVKFTDVQTGEVLSELRGHFAGVHDVVFSPDGKKMATAAADFYLSVWDTGAVAASNSILTRAQISAFDSAGEKVFVWNNADFEFAAWNLAEKRKVWTLKPNINAFSIAFDQARNLLVFGERDGFVSIFKAESGANINRLRISEKSIFAVACLPGGSRIFAADENGFIKSFDTETGSEIFSIKAHAEIIKTLAVSPDGKLLASGGGDKLVKIYDAQTGAEIFTFDENTKPLYKVLFAPDGKTLAASGADDRLRIWDAGKGKLIKEFSGMSGGIFAFDFSPDGKRLATASDVGTIRLWNTSTDEQVLAYTASRRQITNLKFSSDGKMLQSIDAGGKLSIWSAR